jgi:hypothetical protein
MIHKTLPPKKERFTSQFSFQILGNWIFLRKEGGIEKKYHPPKKIFTFF